MDRILVSTEPKEADVAKKRVIKAGEKKNKKKKIKRGRRRKRKKMMMNKVVLLKFFFFFLPLKHLWRRKGHPIPVFLPGESHGQRSLAGYRPWGHKESDTAE